MLSDDAVKELLKVPEIVPPKYRQHTRGDIQTPAQAASRDKMRRRIHISVFGGNHYTYKPKDGGKNASGKG